MSKKETKTSNFSLYFVYVPSDHFHSTINQFIHYPFYIGKTGDTIYNYIMTPKIQKHFNDPKNKNYLCVFTTTEISLDYEYSLICKYSSNDNIRNKYIPKERLNLYCLFQLSDKTMDTTELHIPYEKIMIEKPQEIQIKDDMKSIGNDKFSLNRRLLYYNNVNLQYLSNLFKDILQYNKEGKLIFMT